MIITNSHNTENKVGSTPNPFLGAYSFILSINEGRHEFIVTECVDGFIIEPNQLSDDHKMKALNIRQLLHRTGGEIHIKLV